MIDSMMDDKTSKYRPANSEARDRFPFPMRHWYQGINPCSLNYSMPPHASDLCIRRECIVNVVGIIDEITGSHITLPSHHHHYLFPHLCRTDLPWYRPLPRHPRLL